MAEVDWKAAAVALFNEAWTYIDREDRTTEDDRSMLAAALGSLVCWRKVGTAKNFSISDWQVSRVYALLGDAPLARHYGESALEYAKNGHPLEPEVRAEQSHPRISLESAEPAETLFTAPRL